MKHTQQEIQDFLNANKYQSTYSGINHEFVYGGENNIDLGIQPQHIIDMAVKDLDIIKDRIQKFNEREGIKVGEVINLPDGQQVLITHDWGDSVQTSHGGSMHLSGSGRISYSGGLDSGIKKEELIPTDEVDHRQVWIFHEGRSGAHRGVYYNMPVKVYKTKEGADLSGIPQVEALRKQKIIEQSETITRINGNGQPYTLHMPEVMVVNNEGKYPKEGETEISGLKFKPNHWGNLIAQPMKRSEIDRLLKENDFKAVFYNNGASENKLVLSPTKLAWEITRVFS